MRKQRHRDWRAVANLRREYDVAYPYRRRGAEDFGESELGRHPDDHGYRGRRVDLPGRTLKVAPSADPIAGVRNHLRVAATATAKNAVVVVDPGAWFGQVAWPVA